METRWSDDVDTNTDRFKLTSSDYFKHLDRSEEKNGWKFLRVGKENEEESVQNVEGLLSPITTVKNPIALRLLQFQIFFGFYSQNGSKCFVYK